MSKIKRVQQPTPQDMEDLKVFSERPTIDPEKMEKHKIHKGQHIDNPFQTLEELEAAKDAIDPQLYEAAKADLTRADRVGKFVAEFPWQDIDEDDVEVDTGLDTHEVDVGPHYASVDAAVPCPMTVNKRPTGPVPQPGFVFADKIMTIAEQVADYVNDNLGPEHLNENEFSIPLNLDNDLFKARFDKRWVLDTRIRIFDLLEAACAMVCQLGERGRKLDNRIDELIPPTGPGKAYGIVAIFLDDDSENISLRIAVQKGLR